MWVKTNMDGVVMCAQCDCVASLGEVFSQVGTILFYTEAKHHIKNCTEVHVHGICHIVLIAFYMQRLQMLIFQIKFNTFAS